MQVCCKEKWKWLFEFSRTDGRCSSWSVLAACGFRGAELANSCLAWGICLLFSEALFEYQSGSTSIPRCTATAGVLWKYRIPGVQSPGPAPKSIRMNPSTYARGMSCCKHGDLPLLSGLENHKEGKSEIAWTLLILQELHVALS